jgi:hypothetical protein
MLTARAVLARIIQSRNLIQQLYQFHAETAFQFSASIGKSAIRKPELVRRIFQKISSEMQMANTTSTIPGYGNLPRVYAYCGLLMLPGAPGF